MAGQSVGAIYVDAVLNNKGFNNQVSHTVKGAEKSFSGGFSKIGKVIGAALSVAAVSAFAKSCVDAAAKAESAFMGLNSVLTAQNKSFAEANEFIKEYTADGLVGMTAAVQSYKNLAARGYSTEQIEQVMLALKDSAAFGRAAAYSYEDAITSATEGLRQENSILVDNAGVTKNVAKMWEEYARSIGKSYNELTQQEKIQAEVNGILQETKFQLGDAAKYADTFQGRMSKLKGTFSSIGTEIGNIIIPIADLFIPYIQAAADAVLRFVTRVKQMLAMFGLEMKEIGGDKGSGGMASGMDAAAESAGAAADAIGSTGEAATAAAKAVKRALAPYDELNKLTFASGSIGGSGGGGVGGIAGDAALEDALNSTTEITEKADNAFSKMSTVASGFFEKIKNGFQNAFGDTNFEGIKEHFNNIGKSVVEIFSGKAKEAAGGFVESFGNFIGSAAGAVARLGVNLVEWLLGSFDYALEQIKEDLAERFTRLFDGLSLQLDLGAGILTALGEISDVFKSDEAKRLGGELLAALAIPAGLLYQFAVDTANGVLQSIKQALTDNTEKIQIALTDMFEFVGDLVQPVREAFQGIADKYDEVYKEHLKPAFDKFAQGWSDFVGGFLDTWNEKGKPIMDKIGDIWNEFIKGDLGPAIEKLEEAVGKVVGFFGELWDTLGGQAGEGLGTHFANIAKGLQIFVDVLASLAGVVADLLGAGFETLGGIFETLTGIFQGFKTGDWTKAKDGLIGIASGLGNIVDAILEFLGINFDITEWVADWKNMGKKVVDNFNAGLSNSKAAAQKKWAEVKGWFSDIKKTASIAITQKWSSISKAWSELTKNIKDKTANMRAKVATTWSNIKSAWGNVVNNIKDKTASMKAKVGTTWNSIKNTWNNLIKNFKDKTVTITLKLKSIVGDLKSWVNTNIIAKINKALPIIKIPKLAQGGWLPANAPQLAVVGDNRREGEIVAPESKIREQVKQAITELGGGMFGGTIRLEIAMPDGRIIAREINKAQMAAGRVLLNV